MIAIDYVILGCSPATLSMMLETVHRLHPGGARIRLVRNTPAKDELEFAVEGVEVIEIGHDCWDCEVDIRGGARCLCGVYRPLVKLSVVSFFQAELGIEIGHYANLVHPAAELASTAQLGNAVQIGPQAVLGPYAHIGNFVTLNRAATIGHHTTLGDFVTVNPGANIAGGCRIGEGVAIGIGATVVDGVQIGHDSVIGAGAVVTSDIPERVTAFGVPARIVRAPE